jgi:hypothetical protein
MEWNILCNRHGWSIGLIVRAPVVLIDGDLAPGGGSVGCAAGLGRCALAAGEVEAGSSLETEDW